MKGFGTIFFLITLLFNTACNDGTTKIQSNVPPSSENNQIASEENIMENKENNILVVYFSATGTTKQIADYAEDILNADIYAIVPEVPYTDKDLAYYTGGRADKEQNDSTARPAISGSVENMEQYDTVLLGYPIWHGQAPRIISTFLESYDFSGKTILPFCTSHSSGIGSSATELQSLVENAKWLEGKRFSADTSKEDIATWLDELNITNNTNNSIQLTIGSYTFTATLEKNTSADSFVKMLREKDVIIKMQEYSGFEKVGPLGKTLPTENQQMTTKTGDIVLYGGNQIVVFYGSNTWNYTKLATVDNLAEWEKALGKGDVEITFSLKSKKETTTETTTQKPVSDNSLGDVDNSGNLTASDAANVLAYVLSSDAFPFNDTQLKAADVTKDNVITSSDAASILAKVLDSDYKF